MASSSQSAHCRIGPYDVDLSSGDLSRNGIRLRLQDKPRNILIALIEQPGRIVSRNELRERLWAQDTYVDFEDGLNTAMRKLREALGDDPQAPRFIETIRGRGYRLIAPLDPAPRDPAPPDPAPPDRIMPVPATLELVPLNGPSEIAGTPGDATPFLAPADPLLVVTAASRGTPAPAGHKKIVTTLVLGISGLVIVLLALSIIPKRLFPAPPLSIAVLPFTNMTGDRARDYIANGVTEELIARLGQLEPGHLRVIAPTSAMSYAGTSKDAQQIGRELGVDYLVEGSLQQQGANIRVVAKLVRTRNQAAVWANTYDGDLSDLLEFENSVANSVLHSLALKLPSLPAASYQPAKFAAHDAYLQGLYFLSQRSRSGFEQAMESLGKAVAADPKYADAYARLAVTYNLMGQYNWMSPDNARSQGEAAAEQALALDPGQAEAHAALGFSLWYYRWDRAAAEAEFQKAIALAPQNVDAHHWYAQLLMTDKRFGEAEAQMQAALDLDPQSQILRTNLGWLHYFEGRYPQAIAEMQAVLAENPNFLGAHYKLWYAYSVSGDQSAAWNQFQKIIQAITEPAREQQILGAYAQGGYAASLKALVDSATSQNSGSLVDGARCLAFAGDQAGALQMLEHAYARREGWVMFVAADPAFEQIRNNAQFQKLVHSINARN